MRSFGSLLKAGYIPPNGTWLWKIEHKEPHIQFLRFNYSSSNRQPIFKPSGKSFDPDSLFIHPYFPGKRILAVKIIKPFPFGRPKMIHYLTHEKLNLNSRITFTESDIYQYPTFFKPIYELPG